MKPSAELRVRIEDHQDKLMAAQKHRDSFRNYFSTPEYSQHGLLPEDVYHAELQVMRLRMDHLVLRHSELGYAPHQTTLDSQSDGASVDASKSWEKAFNVRACEMSPEHFAGLSRLDQMACSQASDALGPEDATLLEKAFGSQPKHPVDPAIVASWDRAFGKAS